MTTGATGQIKETAKILKRLKVIIGIKIVDKKQIKYL